MGSEAAEDDEDSSDRDIEADIHAEVTKMKAPPKGQVLLRSANMDMVCGETALSTSYSKPIA